VKATITLVKVMKYCGSEELQSPLAHLTQEWALYLQVKSVLDIL